MIQPKEDPKGLRVAGTAPRRVPPLTERAKFVADRGPGPNDSPAFVLDPAVAHNRTRLRDISRITHHHDEAYVGALAVVIAVRRAATGRDWPNEEIAAELPDSRVRDYLISAAPLSGSLEDVLQQLGSSGFTAETVAVSIELARQICLTSFESAIYALSDLGGDTDIIGAVAGQIAGAALTEVPSHLLNAVPGAERAFRIARGFAEFGSSRMA